MSIATYLRLGGVTVRGVAQGLGDVFGSVAARSLELDNAHATMTAPLALCRQIGFVHLSGGAGASGVAGYVCNALAARRTGSVLAVNASAGPHHLLRRAGIAEPSLDEQADADRARGDRAQARTAAEATAGLGRTPSGLYGLDLLPDLERAGAADVADWLAAVTPIMRFFDVVATDWGVRRPELDLATVAEQSDALCLVTRADRFSCEYAATVTAGLQELGCNVVLAVVDAAGTGVLPVSRELRRRLTVPVLPIPYVRQLAGTAVVGSAAYLPGDRLRLIRLAAALMTVEGGTR